ncbi:FAD-dependent monooxygenase [Nocardia sp. NPDC006044]|uniref:FAD-dependent monooxygenase n=1 Tax=Nocardia sp. NPDC006044 TaxID=3364306 RepID=UPI00367876D4
MPDTDVVIVGGGPTGLLLANELGLAGVRAVVLERDPTRSRQSKALNLQPRSAEILDWRGWLSRMDEFAFANVEWGHFSGIPLNYGALDSRFAHQVGIVQADVEQALEANLAGFGIKPRRGHELVRIDSGLAPGDDQVIATVATADGEHRLTAHYLVGADGGRSTVRKLSGVAFPGRDGNAPAAVCDITLRRKPAGVGESWAMPEFDTERTDFAFLLPLRDGVYRFTFSALGQTGISKDTAVSAEEIQGVLTRTYGPDIELDELLIASRFTDASRQVSEYRTGRVFLAGDAAHIHAPLGGQGMSLGLQDAFNLGWKLAADVHGWAPQHLLDSYHTERHPVAAAVLANTQAQSVLTAPHPDARVVRAMISRLLELPEANLQVAQDVSGLAIRYDLGPGLGHRMPDLDLGDGTRLAEHACGGHGLLLDSSRDHRFAPLADGWKTRIRCVTVDSGALAAAAVLVRPDGYVCASSDDPSAISTALTHWFGAPD